MREGSADKHGILRTTFLRIPLTFGTRPTQNELPLHSRDEYERDVKPILNNKALQSHHRKILFKVALLPKCRRSRFQHRADTVRKSRKPKLYSG